MSRTGEHTLKAVALKTAVNAIKAGEPPLSGIRLYRAHMNAAGEPESGSHHAKVEGALSVGSHDSPLPNEVYREMIEYSIKSESINNLSTARVDKLAAWSAIAGIQYDSGEFELLKNAVARILNSRGPDGSQLDQLSIRSLLLQTLHDAIPLVQSRKAKRLAAGGEDGYNPEIEDQWKKVRLSDEQDIDMQ